MSERCLHVVQLLIRSRGPTGIGFLVYSHDKWRSAQGTPLLTLPTKKTVDDPLSSFQQGTSVEAYVDNVLTNDLHLANNAYALEQEIEPAQIEILSPTHGLLTRYILYPVDVWVDPDLHEELRESVQGQWVTCQDILTHANLSPTAAAVLGLVQDRETRLNARYQAEPDEEGKPEAPRRLLNQVAAHPSMDALAKKWLSRNKHGVRHLEKRTLDQILEAGAHAFNLRVADPYLRFQMQGQGFTWSFFTHKDSQDCHVHGAPVVEIYGILEGRLEVWWKPYYDRGTSAWSHRILEAGDWLEVDSLQCHIVHWLGEGKGVVFKAGPGPLAEVGKLGVKGKTPCKDCPCMKPQPVQKLEHSCAKK